MRHLPAPITRHDQASGPAAAHYPGHVPIVWIIAMNEYLLGQTRDAAMRGWVERSLSQLRAALAVSTYERSISIADCCPSCGRNMRADRHAEGCPVAAAASPAA